jgi:hypothetical protein
MISLHLALVSDLRQQRVGGRSELGAVGAAREQVTLAVERHHD